MAMRSGETPVLIPNTKVKAWTADGTALETVWESRRLPDIVFSARAKLTHRKQVVLSNEVRKNLID